MSTMMADLQVKRMIRFDGEGTLKAYCDLAIGDSFLIKGLRVVHGRHGLFVSMPRQQGKDAKWYDYVMPLSKDVKQELERVILEAYEQQATS